MIRYALACDNGHEFESWFSSGASFDDLSSRGLVDCPSCGSGKVAKRLMAPALASGRPAAAPEPSAPPAPSSDEGKPAQPVAILSEREQAVRAMLRAVREHVVSTADYVGNGFAEEARRMHYGEIEHRSIYGEANPMEARALLEEGIDVHPLPIAPDDRN